VFADAISMAIGNYLSTKSEVEYINKEREREEWEIEHIPEGEINEIREIYRKKGFKGKDLERVVEVITSDKKVWVDTMMMQELGLTEADKTPVKSGIATFIAFIISGCIPLIAFVLALFIPGLLNYSFLLSIILTASSLFVVGSMRSTITGTKWLISGIEMLLIGGLAAIVAYGVGYFLQYITM
jgi:VIT1/CCC1 family predicted Fe2+/Mn2+ transporter